MKKIILYCLLFTVHCSLFSQNPVLLQPWVEVFGTVSGSSLGRIVSGILPSSITFPYKAGINTGSVTGLVVLQNNLDTGFKRTINGRKPLVGDLNADGWQDVVITIRTLDGNSHFHDTVYIYFGTNNGIDTINVFKIPCEEPNKSFTALCIGDVSNDNVNDLVIAAEDFSSYKGKVYVFRGPNITTSTKDTIVGDSILYRLGANVVIGDINSDGFNDLVVRGWYNPPISSQFWYDYINIYLGEQDTINFTNKIQLKGFGLVTRGLACFDVNGDGISDLLWTNRDSTNAELIDVHYGGNNFSITPNLKLQNPGGANFGIVITNAGDMNGDGYDDIAVGTRTGQVTSYAFIYGGGPKINQEYDAYYELSQSEFGSTLASVGDVNGDGLGDIIVGAPGYPFGQNNGYWGIFLGSKNIKVSSVKKEELQQPQFFELYHNYPNPFNGQTTFSYSLEQDSAVRIIITNSLGQEVAILPQGVQHEGFHTVRYNAKDLSSGWYVFTLRLLLENGQSFSQSRAMIVEK